MSHSGELGAASGLVLHGDAGVGKSAILNYVIAALDSAGWLVAVMPHAADWTLGLSARSMQSPNEAYRVTDSNFFSHVPPELEGSALYEAPDATANFLISFYLSQVRAHAAAPAQSPPRAPSSQVSRGLWYHHHRQRQQR